MNKYFHIYLLSILTVLSGCIDISVKEISPASTVTFSFSYTGPETYSKNTSTINLIPTTSAPGFSNFTTTGIFPAGVTLNPSTGAITGTPTQNLALTVFTIQAIAPNGNTVSTQINLTVNDRPVISSVSNFSIDENTSSGIINFNISDTDDTLTCSGSVTATSSNTAVISNSALIVGGVAPNCTISFTPVVNQSGIATITLVVNDSHSTSNSSFVATVTPVDDAPIASNITPAAFNEDTQSIITLSYSDPELDQATGCTLSSLTNVTATQSCGCTSGVCTVGITGTSNYNGSASFNYTVTSNGQTSNSATATLSITPVNDAPVAVLLTPAAFNEDTDSIINLSYSDVEGDIASSCSISGLTNITISTACTCTLGSCSVGVRGTSNYNGLASFNYAVTTGSLTSNSAPVSLTISAVNDAPVMAAISSRTINTNTSTPSISVTVSDVDSPLTCGSSMSMASSNSALVLATAVVWSGTTPNCSAVITPVLNAIGTSDITFLITDGSLNSSRIFTLTVEPIAPSGLNYVGGTFTEDRPVSISRTITSGTNLTYSVISGTIPAGLTLETSGTISGTPSAVESQTITVRAENSKGASESTFSLDVIEVRPSGVNFSMPDIPIRQFTTRPFFVTYSSGSNPQTIQIVNGSLPPGLSLNSGSISGTLLTGYHNQELSFSIRACNGAGCNTESVSFKTFFEAYTGGTPPECKLGSFTGYEASLSKIICINEDGTFIEFGSLNSTGPIISSNSIDRDFSGSGSAYLKAYSHDLNGDGLKEIILLSTDEAVDILSIDVNGDLEFSISIPTTFTSGDEDKGYASLDFGDLINQDGQTDILMTSKTVDGDTAIEIFRNPANGSFNFISHIAYSKIYKKDGTNSFRWNADYNGTTILDFDGDGVLDIALVDGSISKIGIMDGPLLANTVKREKSNPTFEQNGISYGFDLYASSIDDQPGDEIVFAGDASLVIIGLVNEAEVDLTAYYNIAQITGLTPTSSVFFMDYVETGANPLFKTAFIEPKFDAPSFLAINASGSFQKLYQTGSEVAPHYFEGLNIGGVSYNGLIEGHFIFRLKSP